MYRYIVHARPAIPVYLRQEFGHGSTQEGTNERRTFYQLCTSRLASGLHLYPHASYREEGEPRGPMRQYVPIIFYFVLFCSLARSLARSHVTISFLLLHDRRLLVCGLLAPFLEPASTFLTFANTSVLAYSTRVYVIFLALSLFALRSAFFFLDILSRTPFVLFLFASQAVLLPHRPPLSALPFTLTQNSDFGHSFPSCSVSFSVCSLFLPCNFIGSFHLYNLQTPLLRSRALLHFSSFRLFLRSVLVAPFFQPFLVASLFQQHAFTREQRQQLSSTRVTLSDDDSVWTIVDPPDRLYYSYGTFYF